MTLRHKLTEFYQGDTWLIDGELTNDDGTVMVIDPADTIEWALYDEAKTVLATASRDSGISVVDATTGRIMVEVDGASKTKSVPIGSHQDQLRVTKGGVPMTMWIGQVDVDYSPFVTPPA